ncbi:unnamed protein product [Acanthoscelides obtectus]|jgi:hypothetical protein
MESC